MYRPLHFVPSPSIKIERIRNDVLTTEVAAISKRQMPYRHLQILGRSRVSKRPDEALSVSPVGTFRTYRCCRYMSGIGGERT